jgi:hypothetical protein
MSDDQDRERNPWARPTNKEAHAGILWLSAGMIAIGVIGLLAGQPAGVAGVLIGAVWLLIERR